MNILTNTNMMSDSPKSKKHKCLYRNHDTKRLICRKKNCPFAIVYLLDLVSKKLLTLQNVLNLTPLVKTLFKEEHYALLLIIAPTLIFADICLNKDGSFNSLLQNCEDPFWTNCRNEIMEHPQYFPGK